MKKILLSVMMIALLSVAAVGATRAWFTNTETISNMNFATGTLDISNTSDSWMTHVSFTNLKPGDTIRKWVKLTNAGSLDVASLKVSAVNMTDPFGLLTVMTVSVYGQVDGFDQGIYTPDWGAGQPINSWLTTGTNILGTAVYRDATAAHVMTSGKVDTIILDFKVPTSVGNGYQGRSATFDLQFDAEQSHTGASYF